VKIPKEIMDLSTDVTLAANMMFVSILGFLVSAAPKRKLTTTEHAPSGTKPILIKALNKMFNIYNYRALKLVRH
jgi:hypothetical protein